MKYKVFETWNKQGIKYVNIAGIDNLTTRICDPLALAYLVESNFDCLADVIPNQGTSLDYPTILRTQQGTYDQFFPFEVQKINFQRNLKLGQYLVPYLNIYCETSQIQALCYKNHEKLFTYRIREKNDGEGYSNTVSPIKDQFDALPKNFRFEQNIFLLMSLSVRNCLIVRNPQEMLLWDSKTSSQEGERTSINRVVESFKQSSVKSAQKFGRDISHLKEEHLFEGFISKYYTIKEYEEFLFGIIQNNENMDILND